MNKKLVDNLGLSIQQLHTRHVSDQSLSEEWTTLTRGVVCLTQSRAAARARTYIERLRDSWQHLLRDRATRSLTYNDEQFHVLERIKVSGAERVTVVILIRYLFSLTAHWPDPDQSGPTNLNMATNKTKRNTCWLVWPVSTPTKRCLRLDVACAVMTRRTTVSLSASASTI